MTKEYPPYIYGGAGVHVEYLSQALRDLMEVEVRCFGDQRLLNNGLSVKGYRSLQFPEHEDFSKEDYYKVLEPISVNVAMMQEPINSSIIHCHTWYTMFGGFLGKTIKGIPLVTTVHSLEPLRPWKKEQLGRGYYLTSYLEELGLKNSDRIIAVSQGVKEDILRYYDVLEENIRVIYNGVDPNEYKRVENKDVLNMYGISQPYILFVGRLSKQKGILILLDALLHLPKDIQLVLCATSADTEEFADEIRRRVLGMNNIVWINKMLSREDIVQLYSHAHIFVCPSIYEPFGIINLEAMSCEIPVIASSVGGIKEVVVDGETGILVEPGEPEALAVALGHLLNNEDLRGKMGKLARQRVEEHFTWEVIARQTHALYMELGESIE